MDLPASAPEGIRVHCRNCDKSFVVRPYGEQGPPEPPTLGTPPDAEDDAVPPGIFLQKDEVPYDVVLAHRRMEEPPPEPPTPETPLTPEPTPREPTPSGIDQSPDLGPEPELIVDPSLAEESDPFSLFGQEGLPSAASPSLGEGIPIGAKRSRRRLPLWIVGIGLAAAVLLAAILSGRLPMPRSTEPLAKRFKDLLASITREESESGKLQLSVLDGHYLERKGGDARVFVITGKVTNLHKRPCHSIQVKGILFDERGKRAAEEVVYCGNVLSAEEIATAPRKKIEQALQNAYGSTLSNFNIEPGKSVPFMLVFFDPPAKLSEYSLEIGRYRLQESGGE